MQDQDDQDAYKDPALKHFSRPAFMAKHVVKEAAMGGLMGALIGAAVFAVAVVAFGGFLAVALGPVGWILGGVTVASGGVTAAVVAAATAGAMWGGTIGATIKGAMGISGLGDAADSEEQRLIAKYDQEQHRAARSEAIQQQRAAQRAALSAQTADIRGPGLMQGLPRGRGEQMLS